MKYNFKALKQVYGDNSSVEAIKKEARKKQEVCFYDLFGNYIVVEKGARIYN